MTTIMSGDFQREMGMGEKHKIVVPEGMFNAVMDCHNYTPDHRVIRKELEAALQWLIENPLVPEKGFGKKFMYTLGVYHDADEWIELGAKEWQRHMFLAPKEDDPLVMYIMRHFDDIVSQIRASLQ